MLAGGVWEQDTWAEVPARANLATQPGELLHGQPWHCSQVAEAIGSEKGTSLVSLKDIFSGRILCAIQEWSLNHLGMIQKGKTLIHVG